MQETLARHRVQHLCYAGLGIMMVVLIFPCLMTTLFLMEAPWHYLTATQVLYMIVLGLYVVHILLDLAIITCSASDRVKFRTVLAVTCPLLCAVLSIPTLGMLTYTRSKNGFSSTSGKTALGCSVFVILIELLHAVFAAWLYWAYRNNESCCGLYKFPCCVCMVDNAPEDRLPLPSAAEHGDIRVIPSVASWRQDQIDSVVFHPSPSGIVFSRPGYSNQPGSPLSRKISLPGVDNSAGVPHPIPPPPPVERLKFTEGQTGATASNESESLDKSFENDQFLFQPEQQPDENPSGLRPESELDCPISDMAITPDMGLEMSGK